MIRKYFFLCVILFIIPLTVGVWSILFTAPGGVLALKIALFRYGLHDNLKIKNAQGNLVQGLMLSDAEFTGIDILPRGSVISIQKLSIYFTEFHPEGVRIDEVNGRLKIPGFEESLFIFGSFASGIMDFNVYAKHVDVSEIMKEMPLPLLRKLSGGLDEIDLYIKGEASRFNVTGRFKIKKLSYKKSFLSDAQGFTDLEVAYAGKKPTLSGRIELKDGVISGPKMAVIQGITGALQFAGDPASPVLNFKGHSTIDETKINISLKGTMEKPDLMLTSVPSASQEWLLIMLGTGKSWGSVNESIVNQKLSPDVTKDFIDYMIFGGTGSKMAETFGIKEWSILFNEQSQGLTFKKAISDRINALYGVEQTRVSDQQATESTHTFGGEYQVTDSVSLDAARKIKQSDGTDAADGGLQPQPEDAQIMLKYKKNF